eukprot:CFRG5580T1
MYPFLAPVGPNWQERRRTDWRPEVADKPKVKDEGKTSHKVKKSTSRSSNNHSLTQMFAMMKKRSTFDTNGLSANDSSSVQARAHDSTSQKSDIPSNTKASHVEFKDVVL